jgi:hypothetical protein
VLRKVSDSPIKELMKYMLPGIVTASKKAIVIKLNRSFWTTTLFFLALDMCMTIKYLQFCQVCLFAGSLSFLCSQKHHSVQIARQFIGPLLSGANYQHGNDFGFEFYKNRLSRMVDGSTLYFLANIAGWMGSDGYIGLTGIHLSQSNEKLIQSMCKMLNYMFETRTIVYKRKVGANSIDNFDLAFNGSYDIA